MNALTFIPLPFISPWPMWIMVAMMVCLMVCELLQPHLIRECMDNILTTRDRIFGERSSLFGTLCAFLFKSLSIAYILCLCWTNFSSFSIDAYLRVLGLVIGYFLIRRLSFIIISYTFELSKKYAINKHFYASIEFILAIISLPISILFLHFGNDAWIKILAAIVGGLYILTIMIKTTRQCFKGMLSAIYILLYFVTIDLLPFGGLLVGTYYVC